MQALNLDYRRKNPWPLRAGWAGLLLACLVLAEQGWQYHRQRSSIEAGQAEVARLDGQSLAQTVSDPRASRRLEDEMGDARSVLMQLDVPWTQLFETVETSINPNVALLGIEPEPRQGIVHILGEAKNYPAVLDYVRRLEESAPLSGVYLQSHQVRDDDPERPIYFVLGANWKEQP